MNSLCTLYFKNTFNQFFLKSYSKLCDFFPIYRSCVCIYFGNIPGIFSELNTDRRYDDTRC